MLLCLARSRTCGSLGPPTWYSSANTKICFINLYSYLSVIFQIYLPLKYFITWQRYTTTSTVWYLLQLLHVKGAFLNFVSPWAAQRFASPRARTSIVTVRDWSKVTPSKVVCKVLRLIHLKLLGERLRYCGEPTFESKTEMIWITTLKYFPFTNNPCSFCGEGKKAKVTVKQKHIKSADMVTHQRNPSKMCHPRLFKVSYNRWKFNSQLVYLL